MVAISIPNPTINDCNLFQKGQNLIAIIENTFSRDSFRNHIYVTLGRFSSLHSYLVSIGKDCNHICSDSELRIQSYLIP